MGNTDLLEQHHQLLNLRHTDRITPNLSSSSRSLLSHCASKLTDNHIHFYHTRALASEGHGTLVHPNPHHETRIMSRTNSQNLVVLNSSDDLDDWKFVTQSILEGKQLWPFVNGSELRPAGFPGSKQVKAWDTKASQSKAEIIKRIGRKQLQYIHQLGTDPKAIWDRLVVMNSTNGLSAQTVLWDQFDKLKMSKATAMVDHITMLCELSDKLERLFKDKPSDSKFISMLLCSLPQYL